jgi:SM-20-related protein
MNFEEHAQTLETQGHVVIDHFLSATELKSMIDDYERLKRDGHFKKASIGKGNEHQLNEKIRNDETHWLEPSALTASQKMLWNKLEAFKQVLNQHFFLGLWTLEGHYAYYPAGGKYDAHLDRFSNDDARTISMVLYLNQNWNPDNGGELRIHHQNQEAPPIDIKPLGGRLVCFFSADVLHEVLPAKKERMSFAGWWKRRSGEIDLF